MSDLSIEHNLITTKVVYNIFFVNRKNKNIDILQETLKKLKNVLKVKDIWLWDTIIIL